MKSSIAAILALGLCLSQGTLTKACGGANFLRDVGADAAALFGNHDLSDQISGSFSDNDRRKLFGIGDAAPIAIHLPFHKPDDFLGEFQTAAGEIVPHPEANAAPTDTDYLDSIIEEETNGDFNSGQRKLLAGITQLFNHAVRRFGEKAVENGVPAGVRVGANLAHIPTVPADNRKLLGIGDAAPIAIHLPFHKPDDFIGEFQTAAGEIVPHYEPNGNAADITLLTEIEDAPDAKHRVAMGTNPMHSMEFSPQTITIKSGETVTWINMDGLPHDVVFTKVPEGVDTDDIDQTDTIDQDDSFSSTFTTPGEYYYHSDQGVDVTGKVVVKA